MNPVLKVQTDKRDQISFQRNLGGGIDIMLVHPGSTTSRNSITGGVTTHPNDDFGSPMDVKIATLRKEDAAEISKFFAQLT